MTLTQATLGTSLKGRPLEPTGTAFRRYKGSAHPFGSTPTTEGTNFSLFSANATAVQLLLFTVYIVINGRNICEQCRTYLGICEQC